MEHGESGETAIDSAPCACADDGGQEHQGTIVASEQTEPTGHGSGGDGGREIESQELLFAQDALQGGAKVPQAGHVEGEGQEMLVGEACGDEIEIAWPRAPHGMICKPAGHEGLAFQREEPPTAKHQEVEPNQPADCAVALQVVLVKEAQLVPLVARPRMHHPKTIVQPAMFAGIQAVLLLFQELLQTGRFVVVVARGCLVVVVMVLSPFKGQESIVIHMVIA